MARRWWASGEVLVRRLVAQSLDCSIRLGSPLIFKINDGDK